MNILRFLDESEEEQQVIEPPLPPSIVQPYDDLGLDILDVPTTFSSPTIIDAAGQYDPGSDSSQALDNQGGADVSKAGILGRFAAGAASAFAPGTSIEGGGVSGFLGTLAGRAAFDAPVIAATGGVSTAPMFAVSAIKSRLVRSIASTVLSKRHLLEGAGFAAVEAARAGAEALAGNTEQAGETLKWGVPIAMAAPYVPALVQKGRKARRAARELTTRMEKSGTTTNISAMDRLSKGAAVIDAEGRPIKLDFKVDPNNAKSLGTMPDPVVLTSMVHPDLPNDMLPAMQKAVSAVLADAEPVKQGWGKLVANELRASVSHLAQFGETGKEFGIRILAMKEWEYTEAARATTRVAQMWKDLLPEEKLLFKRLADEGPEALAEEGIKVTDRKVLSAVDTWNSVHDGMTALQEGLGSRILMRDGTKVLLSEGKFVYHFPHIYDLEAMTRSKNPAVRHSADEIRASIRELGMPDITGSNTVDQYMARHSERYAKALHERLDKARFWLGSGKTMDDFDPEAAGAAMDRFIRNEYRDIATKKFLGPRDVDNLPFDGEFGLVNVTPIQRALAEKLIALKHEGAKFAQGSMPLADRPISEESMRAAAKEVASGSNGIARAYIEQIHKEYGYVASHRAQALVDILTGAVRYSPTASYVSRTARSINTIQHMTLAFIENAGQLAFTTIPRFGTRRTLMQSMQTLMEMTRNDVAGQGVEYAKSVGAFINNIAQSAEFDVGRGVLARGQDIVLNKITPFGWLEKYMRTVSANTGRTYVAEQFRALAKEPGSKAAEKIWRDFSKLGFRDKEMAQYISRDGITEKGAKLLRLIQTGDTSGQMEHEFMRMAGYRGSKVTQFIGDVVDSPVIADHPIGKMAWQFKTFVYNATKFNYNWVWGELKRGNPYPLGRLLVAGGIAGEIFQDIKYTAMGRNPFERGKRKVGGFEAAAAPGKLIAKLLSGDAEFASEEELFSVLGAKFLAYKKTGDNVGWAVNRLLENVLAGGAIGMFLSVAQSAILGGKEGLMTLIGGPSLGTVADVTKSVVDLLQGKPETLEKSLISKIPIMGRAIQITTMPTDRQLEDAIFRTPDEAGKSAAKFMRADMEDYRQEAMDLAKDGDRAGAVALMRKWNQGITPRLQSMQKVFPTLRSREVSQAMRFSADEMRGLLIRSREEEPGVMDRLGIGAPAAGMAFGGRQMFSNLATGGSMAKDAPHLWKMSQLAEQLETAMLADRNKGMIHANVSLTKNDYNIIRLKTGWFKGPDDLWRYEINDQKARLKPWTAQGTVLKRLGKTPSVKRGPGEIRFGDTIKLGDFLDHPELYKAYPQAATDVKVVSGLLMPMGDGSFYINRAGEPTIAIGGKGRISKSSAQTWKKSPGSLYGQTETVIKALMHEVGHYIDYVEGFARGGNPAEMGAPSSKLMADAYMGLNKAQAVGGKRLIDVAKKLGFSSSLDFRYAKALTRGGPEDLAWPNFDLKNTAKLEKAYNKLVAAAQADLDITHYIEADFNVRSLDDAKAAAYEKYRSLLGEISSTDVGDRLRLRGMDEISGSTPTGSHVGKDTDWPGWASRFSRRDVTPALLNVERTKNAIVLKQSDKWSGSNANIVGISTVPINRSAWLLPGGEKIEGKGKYDTHELLASKYLKRPFKSVKDATDAMFNIGAARIVHDRHTISFEGDADAFKSALPELRAAAEREHYSVLIDVVERRPYGFASSKFKRVTNAQELAEFARSVLPAMENWSGSMASRRAIQKLMRYTGKVARRIL